MTEVQKFNPGKLVSTGLTKALRSQQSVAVANVARLRRVHPGKSPAQLVKYLNKVYTGTVTATGAGAGAAAAVPNAVVQVPAAIADALTYLEASVLYVLSVMEIHKLHVEDAEKRRLLVTAVLLGNTAATQILEKVIGRTAPHWGKEIVKRISRDAIKQVNRVLGPRFVTLTGQKVGVLVLGKQVPLMIGAVLGGAGNALFGIFVIRSARAFLGPAPDNWDDGSPVIEKTEKPLT